MTDNKDDQDPPSWQEAWAQGWICVSPQGETGACSEGHVHSGDGARLGI